MERPHEIDRFEKYIERGKIEERDPDPSQAKSLLKRSRSKFKNMESLGTDDETATDYVENVYEATKMLIQSLMATEGYRPYGHEAVIAYAIDQLELDMVNANSLNRYRKLRNDIVYRGEISTQKEAENIRELYREIKEKLKPEIREKIETDQE